MFDNPHAHHRRHHLHDHVSLSAHYSISVRNRNANHPPINVYAVHVSVHARKPQCQCAPEPRYGRKKNVA